MKNASISKIIEFVDELEKQPSLDIDQVWDYAQWSGRLNSLGYGEYQERFLQTYPEEQINAILKSRINEGLEDITEAFGEYLAVEIFTVQDFVCFVNHAPAGLIHDDVKQLLDFWVRTAEVQDLDEEAAQTLEVFLDSFPIPEEEQLDIVSAPLTKDALDFWDKALEPITEIIAEKSKDLESKIHLEQIEQSGTDNVVSLRISGVDLEEIAHVRIQGVPGIRSGKGSDTWTFDFTPFGIEPSTEDKVVVRMFDGCRAEIPCEYISRNVTSTPQEMSVKYTNILATHHSFLLAAGEPESSRSEIYKISDCDIELVFTQDDTRHCVLINVFSTSDSDDFSSEIDGWTIRNQSKGTLATITNGFASITIDDLKSGIALFDETGKYHTLESSN